MSTAAGAAVMASARAGMENPRRVCVCIWPLENENCEKLVSFALVALLSDVPCRSGVEQPRSTESLVDRELGFRVLRL